MDITAYVVEVDGEEVYPESQPFDTAQEAEEYAIEHGDSFVVYAVTFRECDREVVLSSADVELSRLCYSVEVER